MTSENDLILSRLTVRLKDFTTSAIIGSGVLYYNNNLKDKIYVLTAAHNLYLDGDEFKKPIVQIRIDLYNPTTSSYQEISHFINYSLVCNEIDKDVAILLFEKNDIESITGVLDLVPAIKERLNTSTFTLKGFPNATLGQEIVCINPLWSQQMTGVDKFQLLLTEDYSGWAIGGFSGSGIFLHAHNQLYLFGVFTRYREEERGKIIYCQNIETINEILEKNFLPLISYTFLGQHGMTSIFFRLQVETAIKNLGPRFNEKLNFRLPIVTLFNDLAKDDIFKKRLSGAIDKWLIAPSYNYYVKDKKIIEDIEEELSCIKSSIISWLKTISWNVDQQIDLQDIISHIDALNSRIRKLRHSLQELQWKEKEKTENKDRSVYNQPYEPEINRLDEIFRNNRIFINELDRINIKLTNNPCLIIQGDAGCGKSHLLGDIACERIKKNQQTILLLGQLFKNGLNAWQNILNQLNLTCTKDDFLISLNCIGQQTNSRVLILIDALNEGAGKDLWHDELSGFITDLSRFPYIGLVMSIRNTYYSVIVPDNIRNDDNITQETHNGFKGNEYAALRLFCDYYDIEQPNFPLLAPEFTNPLFLQLICSGIKRTEHGVFPQGFQGMNKIFGYYIDEICCRLIKKREEYRSRKSIIKRAIYGMAKNCFEHKDTRVLSIEDANNYFDTEFPNYRNLLNDLIFENVFIQSIHTDYETANEIDIVYFSYERLGDYLMAEDLLTPHKTMETVKEAFQKNNQLGKLLDNGAWRNKGILDALAILLPEKFKLEIVEVFDWVFDEDKEDIIDDKKRWLNRYLIESLKWRTIECIDNIKLTSWIRSDKFYIDQDLWYNSLIELTTYKNHPFNSDRLFLNLKQFSMPQRDSFWQQYVWSYSTSDDDDNAYPIRRLIDWAWTTNISSNIDDETARLTGQTLTWVLASTNKKTRDQATKAMVNVLEEQPDALIRILEAFKDIDDLYILERLYGIAYGCSLRTSKDESLKKIAQYVFNTIFREGTPPKHILLRDYARNTVEYAIYKKISLVGDLSLIKPPYKSNMPLSIIDEEQLKTYEIDYDSPDFKEKYKLCHNRIKYSVMGGDFGTYIVSSALRDFCPVSFTLESECKSFLKKLKPKERDLIKLIDRLITIKSRIEQERNNPLSDGKKESIDTAYEFSCNQLVSNLEIIRKTFEHEDYVFFSQKILPYLNAKLRTKDWRRDLFDVMPIQRWIVQRVFEHGYDSELHGSYDSSVVSYYNYYENKVERIGKKYQWISLYEIMASVADNYKIIEYGWGVKPIYKYYSGAWQGYLRNIDPVFITKNMESEDEQLDTSIISGSKWWLDTQYNYWNLSDSKWLSSIEDLPELRHIILRNDESGHDWIYLKTNLTWSEPKPIGEEKYDVEHKEIWFMIQSYFVNKKDASNIVKLIKHKDFRRRWLPESNPANTSLFNRENYWSPASKENVMGEWVYIQDTRYKIMVSTSQAVGELSEDQSGAHFYYDMPCKLIFEDMKLQYAPNDGEFKNEADEIVVINPDHRGMLIRKDYMQSFLNRNDLELIWVILGEKRLLKGNNAVGGSYFKTINGIYYLEDGIISGSIRFSSKD